MDAVGEAPPTGGVRQGAKRSAGPGRAGVPACEPALVPACPPTRSRSSVATPGRLPVLGVPRGGQAPALRRRDSHLQGPSRPPLRRWARDPVLVKDGAAAPGPGVCGIQPAGESGQGGLPSPPRLSRAGTPRLTQPTTAEIKHGASRSTPARRHGAPLRPATGAEVPVRARLRAACAWGADGEAREGGRAGGQPPCLPGHRRSRGTRGTGRPTADEQSRGQRLMHDANHRSVGTGRRRGRRAQR